MRMRGGDWHLPSGRKVLIDEAGTHHLHLEGEEKRSGEEFERVRGGGGGEAPDFQVWWNGEMVQEAP